jgi:hypothetical protein
LSPSTVTACFRRLHFDPPFIKKAVLFLTPPVQNKASPTIQLRGDMW